MRGRSSFSHELVWQTELGGIDLATLKSNSPTYKGAVPFGAKRRKTHETGETLFAHGTLGRKAPERTTPSLGPAGPLLPPKRGRGKQAAARFPHRSSRRGRLWLVEDHEQVLRELEQINLLLVIYLHHHSEDRALCAVVY
jgi:hypothetical protein